MVEKYTAALNIDETDQVIDTWILMQAPFPIVSIVLVYLGFVLKVGPMLMKNRGPLNLKNTLIVYNLFQVCFYIWLCSLLFREDENPFEVLLKRCGSVKDSERYKYLLAYSGWWFLFSKVLELLDTVFFVLRKKQSQVTFLHVYHHTVMVLGTWWFLKFSRDEQAVVPSFINSVVHIIMYFYYFLAALGPQYRKYLWWKKYMTSIQLASIQFCLILVYFIHITLMQCLISREITIFFVINVIVFIYLFTDFYRKTYRKSQKRSATEGQQKMKQN